MSAFFPERQGAAPRLAVFLHAGDPPLGVLRDVLALLDARGVECLELAVPFADPPTGGPVIRRSARRALERGVDLDATLALIAAVRPELKTLRIALLADWRHTVKGLAPDELARRVRTAGPDGMLLHGLPSRARPAYYAAARRAGIALVTTCYAGSPVPVREEAARNGSAYVYLVAHYGRSGMAPAPTAAKLKPAVEDLRRRTSAPIAVGFGLARREDLEDMRETGADAAVVGSAFVARVERALEHGRDVVEVLGAFLDGLGRTG